MSFKQIKISSIDFHLETLVSISCWVQFARDQKNICFLEVRDGSHFGTLQVVLKDESLKEFRSLKIVRESTVCCKGTLRKNHKQVVELCCSSISLLGSSEVSLASDLNQDTLLSTMIKKRHLQIRGPVTKDILRMSSHILRCFQETLLESGALQAEPPLMMVNQVEGGSTLFEVDFFGTKAYLSQSAQLYLEAMTPVIGDCFAVTTSFRAEKSHTRRHLTEYTHLEGEYNFIDFEGLLAKIEDLFVTTTEKLFEQYGEVIAKLNPGFRLPKRGIKRMTHRDAVRFCIENSIKHPDGAEIKESDDISESSERKMIDLIREPVMLVNFPITIKPFYMQRVAGNENYTNSVDLLVPNVGEILGGSMREADGKVLEKRLLEEKLDLEKYAWYLDLRKYGTYEHGGFGLGIARYTTWLLGQDNIRKVVAFPRYDGNLSP